MGKAEHSWSGMRRYLETQMLAPTLRGRVRYHCASYSGMNGGLRFEVLIDEKKICCFSMETMAKTLYNGPRPIAPDALNEQFWKPYWQVRNTVPPSQRQVHDDMDFADALRRYREQTIERSIHDENPIVRMFAVLDRRVGKRTLRKWAENQESVHTWLQPFYALRF